MLACHVEPGTNVVELIIDGKITKEDFDRVRLRLEEVIAEHGQLCVLKHVRSLGTFPPSRLWADLEWSMSHLTDVARIAVVVDKHWMERISRMLVKLAPVQAKLFDVDELDEARAWLRQYGHENQLKTGKIDEFHVTV